MSIQTQLQQITVQEHIFGVQIFAPINISLLPFCDSKNTDSFLTIQFRTKTIEKHVRNHQKFAKKKTIQKIETVRY